MNVNFIVLHDCINVSDTCQLSIFVRGVTSQFIIVEDLIDLCSMKGSTTGRDIFDEVRNAMTTIKLNDENLCGSTTDRAQAIVGNQNDFEFNEQMYETRHCKAPLHNTSRINLYTNFEN